MVLLYNQLRGIGMDHEMAWFYVRHLYAGNGLWRESTPELAQTYPRKSMMVKRGGRCPRQTERLV